MNSDFVRTQAEAMARMLIESEHIKQEKRGAAAFYLAYGRPPSAEENRKSSLYFKKSLELSKQDGAAGVAYFEALTGFCHSLLASADFLYIN